MFGIGKKKEEKQTSCYCGTQVEAGGPQDAAEVKVLGSGCAGCRTLLENTQKAVQEMGKEGTVSVEYVTDLEKITAYGIMSLPALVVNGKIASVGRVLKPAEIREILGK